MVYIMLQISGKDVSMTRFYTLDATYLNLGMQYFL